MGESRSGGRGRSEKREGPEGAKSSFAFLFCFPFLFCFAFSFAKRYKEGVKYEHQNGVECHVASTH